MDVYDKVIDYLKTSEEWHYNWYINNNIKFN
jgi:hypothetical protein